MDGNVDGVEFAEYLAQVCIRVVQGAGFYGRFFLHYGEPTDSASTWYECGTCLISNVAIAVQPGQVITAEIEFVTSGPIVLHHGMPVDFLLQDEQSVDGMFLLEQPGESKLELENNDR